MAKQIILDGLYFIHREFMLTFTGVDIDEYPLRRNIFHSEEG